MADKLQIKILTEAERQIRGLPERVDPATLRGNPANWRLHSPFQASVLEGEMEDVGVIGCVLVNIRSGEAWPEGERHVLTLVDGHLRAEIAQRRGEPELPVLYCDLAPSEEGKALLMFDAIGALATADAEAQQELIRQVETDNEALKLYLEGLAEASELPGIGTTKKPKLPEPGVVGKGELTLRFIVTFRNEAEEAEFAQLFGFTPSPAKRNHPWAMLRAGFDPTVLGEAMTGGGGEDREDEDEQV